jgi:hypothetical protein
MPHPPIFSLLTLEMQEPSLQRHSSRGQVSSPGKIAGQCINMLNCPDMESLNKK